MAGQADHLEQRRPSEAHGDLRRRGARPHRFDRHLAADRVGRRAGGSQRHRDCVAGDPWLRGLPGFDKVSRLLAQQRRGERSRQAACLRGGLSGRKRRGQDLDLPFRIVLGS
jgi:hypothetical protein